MRHFKKLKTLFLSRFTKKQTFLANSNQNADQSTQLTDLVSSPETGQAKFCSEDTHLAQARQLAFAVQEQLSIDSGQFRTVNSSFFSSHDHDPSPRSSSTGYVAEHRLSASSYLEAPRSSISLLCALELDSSTGLVDEVSLSQLLYSGLDDQSSASSNPAKGVSLVSPSLQSGQLSPIPKPSLCHHITGHGLIF